jgi:hypothetical protein
MHNLCSSQVLPAIYNKPRLGRTRKTFIITQTCRPQAFLLGHSQCGQVFLRILFCVVHAALSGSYALDFGLA